MESLQNRFLISMPQLLGQEFYRTVILMCHHAEDGAIGIVINKMSSHSIGELFSQLDIIATIDTYSKEPVLQGGPVVPELGLVIHNGQQSKWESSLRVNEDLFLTSSKEILNDMASGTGPERALVAFGYAGWGPGQLESEICGNAWLTAPVDQEILFSAPFSERWHLSASILGIDISHVSDQIANA